MEKKKLSREERLKIDKYWKEYLKKEFKKDWWLFNRHSLEVPQKIRQIILMLLGSVKFNKKITELKKVWRKEIGTWKKGDKKAIGLVKKLNNLSEIERVNIYKQMNLLTKPDERLDRDLIALCGEYKLNPLADWRICIGYYLKYNKLMFPTFTFFRKGLWIAKKGQRYFAPNCYLLEEEDKITKEPKLFIQIFPETTQKDIKKIWNRVEEEQKKLRKTKRYYPHKNLAIAIKLLELDKKKGLTDWEKAEELYGEIKSEDWGIRENKRRKNLKQIRHRAKKFLK